MVTDGRWHTYNARFYVINISEIIIVSKIAPNGVGSNTSYFLLPTSNLLLLTSDF